MTKFSLFSFAALATLAVSTTLAAPANALDLDRIERRAGSALSGFMDVARDRFDGDHIGGGRVISLRSFGLPSGGGLKALKSKKLQAAKLKQLKAAKSKQAKLKAAQLKAAAADRGQIK